MDDHGRHPGAAARTAAARALGWRPVRDLRFERPLSAGYQPEQSPEAFNGVEGAGRHHPKRNEHAAGSGGRAVRQWTARARDSRSQQAAVEIVERYVEGQAGPVSAESPGQTGGLFWPHGDRRGSRIASSSVRASEEDGPRALQAVYLP